MVIILLIPHSRNQYWDKGFSNGLPSIQDYLLSIKILKIFNRSPRHFELTHHRSYQTLSNLGLEFAKNDFIKEHNLANFLLRTGLGKKAEFRLGVSYHQLDSTKALPVKTSLVKPCFQLDLYVSKQDALESDRIFFGLGAGFRLDKGDLTPKTFKDIGIHH